jgi:hypothetical protein
MIGPVGNLMGVPISDATTDATADSTNDAPADATPADAPQDSTTPDSPTDAPLFIDDFPIGNLIIQPLDSGSE